LAEGLGFGEIDVLFGHHSEQVFGVGEVYAWLHTMLRESGHNSLGPHWQQERKARDKSGRQGI
jgi:hypothetical protein